MMQEKFFVINDAGCSVKCKLYTSDGETKKLVLFCHGFGGHKDNKAAARFADRALSKNKEAAVMTFDWPCHGDDARRRLRLADCGAYMGLAVKALQAKFPQAELYGYATSFGAYLTLKYVAENGSPFVKLALRCPAVNMYEVLTESIIGPEEQKRLSKGREALVGFDRKIKIDPPFLAELRAADITGWNYTDAAESILILHGTKDEIVPFETARDFAARNQIRFIPVENADHRFIDSLKMDAASQEILQFFAF